MYAPVNKSKENSFPTTRQESRAVANSVGQKKSDGEQDFGFVDNRPAMVTKRKVPEGVSNNSVLSQPKSLTQAKTKNSSVLQKYSYNAEGAEITAHFPNNDTRKWTESTEAKVKWNMGEEMDPQGQGTSNVTNRGWMGVLKNKSNNNNATGLHVVNANWGGSGDAEKGNVVPGTPSLNGHHKVIENEVHKLFNNNGGKAPANISYKADVWTPYKQTINLKNANTGEEFNYRDPTIRCTVKVGSNKVVDNEKVELGGGTKIVVP